MNQGRLFAGLIAGALVAAGVAVVPAGAAEQRRVATAPKRATPARGAGSFTPAAADPRLAALFARGGLETRGFRFTPSEAKNTRAVTVAVRARTNRPAVAAAADRTAPATPAAVGLAPIAYNLGVAVGWRRFAMTGDVAKVDTPGQADGGRERAEVGVSYSLPRLTTRVKAGADRATGVGPRLADGERSYSLDVGGSYSLTRNLDVTAGVRYRSDRDRLPRIDDRRDSQAVYVGTAFRF
ncbi:porin [Sphingomonas lenta]|uniref:porin n=1 Tax=Sphingomonas lenta TaxID=1141887 RepID=UPI001FEB0B6A|nr:porin [Sphingomonas lenta]